jgi:hypothetical protein
MASVRETRLERLQIGLNSRLERQPCQVREVVGAERRPEPLLTDAFEFVPVGLAGVAFQNHVPLLGRIIEVVGCEPNAIGVGGVLGAKETLTLVEPSERISLAVV